MDIFIKNVINKKFDANTIDFLFKNSLEGSILNSVLKLRKSQYIITKISDWKFKPMSDYRNEADIDGTN